MLLKQRRVVSRPCNENEWLLKLELSWSKSVPLSCLDAIQSGCCGRLLHWASEGQDGYEHPGRKWGRRSKCLRYTWKSIKSVLVQLLSRQLLVPRIAWKSLFVTNPQCPLLLQLNKERKNLAKDTRWELTDEKARPLNSALNHFL